MKRFLFIVAAAAAVSACSGGNPFVDGGTGGELPTVGVPAELASDLDSITYNRAAQTLTVTGMSLDVPREVVYTRKAALDRPGYEAYSAQDSSLGRHFTAYVRSRGNVTGAIVVSGGQFEEYYRGGTYARGGAFDRPDTQANEVIEYVGSYIGLRNAAGDGGDLLPVTPGTPTAILSSQAAEVTGGAVIRADFNDNVVDGVIYNRQTVDDAGLAMPDLALDGTSIEDDGSFTGTVSQSNQVKGSYGGIFGGQDAAAVAGTLFAKDHIPGRTTPEEQGLFVLARCGTPNADPLCNQPTP